MQIQGPSAVVVVAPQATVTATITFDLNAHTFTIFYGSTGPGTPGKVLNGAIPAGLLTALENHIKAQIEANEGWNAGSSSVTP